MTDTLSVLTERWLHIYLVDFSRYLIAAGGITVALWLARRWAEPRRIQARSATRADKLREFGFSAQTVAIFALNGLGVFLLIEMDWIEIRESMPGLAPGLVEFVLIVVAHDAYFYWMHRFLHTRAMFRRAHAVHHRSRTPTPWAAYAFAPIESVFEAIFLPLFLLIVPMHGIVIFAFLIHQILRNAAGHSGHELMPSGFTRHWLGKWFTTAVHHDLHHSEGRNNFGLYFTWWDRLMGTEHPDYHARFEAVAKRDAVARNG